MDDPSLSLQSWNTPSTSSDTSTTANESQPSSTTRTSILCDTTPSARQEMLNSPLVELRIAYVDGYIPIPERLISAFSPFVRNRIAEWRSTITSNILAAHPGTPLTPDALARLTPGGPAIISLPFVHEHALEWLLNYMLDACITGADVPLEPPPEPRNMVLTYHCIRVLQMPFCEKKFQASIMDFLSREVFDAGDVKAVWLFMGEWKGEAGTNLGRHEKIVSHMVQNVAYRSEEGRLPEKGDVWQFVRSVPELEVRVVEALLRLRREREHPKPTRGPGGGYATYVGGMLRLSRSMDTWSDSAT